MNAPRENHQLVPSVSIANMLNQRDQVLATLRQAVDLIRDAATLAGAAHIGFPDFVCGAARNGVSITAEKRPDLDEKIQQEIDLAAWQYLMHESGMRTFMDATARKAWDEAIYDRKFPPLSANAITETFRTLHDQRGDLFERGVIACFKNLAWDYKTNRPFAFGKRIVVEFVVDKYGMPSHTRMDWFADLARVFHVFDGKPEPDHRVRSLLWDLHSMQGWPREVADEYCAYRVFKNGNGHVTFKRPDLVEKMNAILAKHFPGALPWDHHKGQS